MVDVVDQVLAVRQTPAMFPLIIAGFKGWVIIYMVLEDALEEYTGEIDTVTVNG